MPNATLFWWSIIRSDYHPGSAVIIRSSSEFQNLICFCLFRQIYSGLEKSATILGHNLSENSVKIIEHRYGPSAGCVAADTLDTVGNVINLSQNVNYMTPRGLAKKTFKGTGKAIFTDFRPKTNNYVAAGSLYPDLTQFTKQVANSK